MFNVVVEWLDERKSRARFALPGRQEWNAQHISDLIQVLSEIRAEMSPARFLAEEKSAWEQFRRR
jgi:hypothetical protein